MGARSAVINKRRLINDYKISARRYNPRLDTIPNWSEQSYNTSMQVNTNDAVDTLVKESDEVCQVMWDLTPDQTPRDRARSILDTLLVLGYRITDPNGRDVEVSPETIKLRADVGLSTPRGVRRRVGG